MKRSKLMLFLLVFLLVFGQVLPVLADLAGDFSEWMVADGMASIDLTVGTAVYEEAYDAIGAPVTYAVYMGDQVVDEVYYADSIFALPDEFSVVDDVYTFSMIGALNINDIQPDVTYTVYASVGSEIIATRTFAYEAPLEEGSAPTASAVGITGTARVGQTLTGSYTFADVDEDEEGVSTYRWLRADSGSGTYAAITGATATTYTLTSSDLGKYIKFEVTPKTVVVPTNGTAVFSSAFGPVEAAPSSSGGSSGGSSSGGSNTTTTTNTTTNTGISVIEKKADGTVAVEVKPALDAATGEAKATVSASDISNALSQTVANADGIKAVTLEMPKVTGATAYTQELPKDTLVSGNAAQVIEIATEFGTIAAPTNMFNANEVAGATNVGLTIAKAEIAGLSAEVLAAIGSRPVIELNAKADGRVIFWNNPDAPVTIRVPYTPAAAELADPDHIVVWYIDSSGNAVEVPTGKYDPVTGTVSFETTHFSKYAIAYVKKSFNDLTGYSWAKKYVEVLASKGIVRGTSKTAYSPAAQVTRVDFIVMLVRALGLSAKVDSNFSDVKTTDHYYEALGIAKKLGIAKGYDNKFDPKTPISRQDMMVLADRAMKAASKLKATGNAADLNKFADKDSIASYAKSSVAVLVKEGIILGDGKKINPKAHATRAEIAAIVYRIYKK